MRVIPRVLMVEDNPLDVHMTRWALQQIGYAVELIAVDDGAPALAYLRNQAPYENHGVPDLVFLDLKLKCVDGPEVLACIRETKHLRHLKVIVFSGSMEGLQTESSSYTANGYFEKPSSPDGFVAVMQEICKVFFGPIQYLNAIT